VIDVGGIGYGVEVPLSCLGSIPDIEKKCFLWVFTKVREDSIKLFGFTSWAQRNAFSILININGVGPKVAIAILSTLSVGELSSAVELKEIEKLQLVPGIGKRTAEKILLELNSKSDRLTEVHTNECDSNHSRASFGDLGFDKEEKLASNDLKDKIKDLKSALNNLGFKEKDISLTVDQIKKSYEGEDISDLIKNALTLLSDKSLIQKHSQEKKSDDLDQLF
tara:strand:- start:279 stop:944 length:666 start_codon:yes stop_codon:yes gene_type:complete